MGDIRELKLSFERKRVDDDLLGQPVESAAHVYHLFREMENEVREKLICLHLTDKYEVISFELVAMGNQHYLYGDPVEILRGAVIVQAKRIVVVHNHPLGSPEPSEADIRASKDLKDKAAVLNIRLQDSIIVGQNGFVSLVERGLI